MKRNEIIQGDALSVLKTLPDACVQCVVTSPPYYALRDYGVDGQIGLEKTLQDYLTKLVEVFREVRRVLRSDGTCWVNIGDTYADGSIGRADSGDNGKFRGPDIGRKDRSAPAGFKSKDLMMVPARLAIALQEDGWYLRSDIVWNKVNCMPESVADRPTKSHEYVFLLAKSERYFYDADAIREPHSELVRRPNVFKQADTPDYNAPGAKNPLKSKPKSEMFHELGRNKRSVWSIATTPFPNAHFAVMAPELAELCILAGSSPRACEHCSAPWQRETAQTGVIKMSGPVHPKTLAAQEGLKPIGQTSAFRSGLVPVRETIGWEPTCQCDNTGAGRCIVLDPFSGAGTTAYVALRHGRDYLGIELNPEYVAMAERRLAELTPGLWGFSEKAAR